MNFRSKVIEQAEQNLNVELREVLLKFEKTLRHQGFEPQVVLALIHYKLKILQKSVEQVMGEEGVSILKGYENEKFEELEH